MDIKQMEAIALEAGFEKTKLLSTEELVFVHEYRKYCEENACGNYNKNYGCPPYCGTPEEMEERVMTYKKALVFQTKTYMKDIFDEEETKKSKKIHTKKTFQAVKKMQEAGLDEKGIYAMCGPCSLCSQCKIVLGEPCVQEEKRTSCLSAYCIDVTKLAESCGMEITWVGNEVSFFSIYFFDKK